MEEKRVCENCFGNEYLKEYIRKNGELDFSCDYCSTSHNKTTKISNLSEYIKSKLNRCYVLFDKKGDQVIPSLLGIISKEKIASLSLLGELTKSSNNLLLTEIIRRTNIHFLSRATLYTPSMPDHLRFSVFQNRIKHENRFFFKKEEINFLNSLIKIIKSNPFTLKKCGEVLYRSRRGLSLNIIDLFPPEPKLLNTPNRMTPPGISAIYCSDNIDTTLLEIFAGNMKDEVSIAKIKIIKEFNIVDFSLFKEYPNVFSPDFDTLEFMFFFTSAISDPVSNFSCGYEYAPTQVITEYIKTQIPEIKGIAYPSSRSKTGKNYVLFMNKNNCTINSDTADGNKYLLFEYLSKFSVKYYMTVEKETTKEKVTT